MPARRGGRRLRSETATSVVAVAGVMVVQRRRWIGMELMIWGRRDLLGGDDEGSKKKVEEMGRTKEV